MLLKKRLPLLLLATCFGFIAGRTLPAHAQEQSGFGYDGSTGLRGKFRTVGGEWQLIPPRPDHPIRAGELEGSAPLDGIVLRENFGQLETQVLVAGAWQAWVGDAKPAGTAKKPIEGIRIRAVANGSVRYRVASGASDFSAWFEDGGTALAPNGGPLNAIEVQWRPIATKAAKLEYRALFAGHAIGPWLQEGVKAEAENEKAELIGLEVRTGHGIRYEVILDSRRWQPTAIDGEQAGDASGKHRITAVRVFGGSFPVRYKVRNVGSAEWSSWCTDGSQCPESLQNHPIDGILIEPDRVGR